MNTISTFDEEGLSLKYMFSTHGHVDHVIGIADIRARYPEAQWTLPAGGLIISAGSLLSTVSVTLNTPAGESRLCLCLLPVFWRYDFVATCDPPTGDFYPDGQGTPLVHEHAGRTQLVPADRKKQRLLENILILSWGLQFLQLALTISSIIRNNLINYQISID
ncbi:hypothetical protein GF407_14000 [candidate division KSB1 bacterium]|nr:hypothetical protein [candidate division KSB1 bacterium]